MVKLGELLQQFNTILHNYYLTVMITHKKGIMYVYVCIYYDLLSKTFINEKVV